MPVNWQTIGVRYTDTINEDNIWLSRLMRQEQSTNINKAIDKWIRWQEAGCDGPPPQKSRLHSWRQSVSRIKAIPALNWVRDQVHARQIYKLVFMFHHDNCGELMRACLNDRKVRVDKIQMRTRKHKRERSIGYFDSRASRKVIVCQDKLAALLDLTVADMAAFAMLNMLDPDLNWQALRCITPERKRPQLTAYNIVLLGSRDEEISEILMQMAIANRKRLPSFATQDAILTKSKANADAKDRLVANVARKKDMTHTEAAKYIGRFTAANIGMSDIKEMLEKVIDKTELAVAADILHDHGAAKLSELYVRHYKSVMDNCKEILG